MSPLHLLIGATLCISSAMMFSVDVQESDLDNQILVTGEVTLTDCQVKDFSRWEKLMTMLENSHMRQNMLLQYFEELKVDILELKADLWLLGANVTGSCRCLKDSEDKKCQTDEVLAKTYQELISSNLDITERLDHIETILTTRVEEPKKPECPKVSDDDGLEAKINLLLKWIDERNIPSGCDSAILFPMRSPKIYASVHPAEMSLQAFTFCVWIKATEALEKTIVFSYGTKRNPYEIQLSLNKQSPVLVVGGDKNKISSDNAFPQGEWANVCGTWNSEDGATTLWVNGDNKAVRYDLAKGHVIPDRGIFQLGQEKNGCCVGGGFDESLAFSGKITGFNMWNNVLSQENIVKAGSDCSIRGNVVGWGTTEVQAHGGAQYIH